MSESYDLSMAYADSLAQLAAAALWCAGCARSSGNAMYEQPAHVGRLLDAADDVWRASRALGRCEIAADDWHTDQQPTRAPQSAHMGDLLAVWGDDPPEVRKGAHGRSESAGGSAVLDLFKQRSPDELASPPALYDAAQPKPVRDAPQA